MDNIFGSKMNKIYGKISNKINNKAILDSEIILEMETVRKKDPGFDINWKPNNQNWPLLTRAVFYEREELVKYLLMVPDIDVNNRGLSGATAFHFAGNINILKLLLNCRDLDVTNPE